MDSLSEARLAEITAKSVLDLTDDDKAFMRARASYLTGDQREMFAEVLHAQPEAAPSEDESQTETPKKKAK